MWGRHTAGVRVPERRDPGRTRWAASAREAAPRPPVPSTRARALVERIRRDIPPPTNARGRCHPYCIPSVYVAPCDGSVYIHTDDGRVVRPLLTVRPGSSAWVRPRDRPPGDVAGMLTAGDLRYVDAAEVGALDVALDPGAVAARLGQGINVDLMEVHAHLMLGVTAALIPLLQANQSPRNAYQTSMGRQAVGAPLPPGPFELAPALCYAQQPLCPATAPGTSLSDTECGLPMGQTRGAPCAPRRSPARTSWWPSVATGDATGHAGALRGPESVGQGRCTPTGTV